MAEQLKARHLYYFRAGECLLENVSLTLRDEARIGLVGRNGAGKSTLLQILAGELAANDGQVLRLPAARLAYLQQSLPAGEHVTLWQLAREALKPLAELEQAIRTEEASLAAGTGDLERYGQLRTRFERQGGYKAEATLEKHLFALGFIREQFDKQVRTLSGGERSRLHLASVLTLRPDVLLLDEPTNHLDIAMRRWLASTLKKLDGAQLIVSHDRQLLDSVCTHIAELKGGTLTLYKGDYARYHDVQQASFSSLNKKAKEAAKRRARLEQSQQRLRSWGTAKAHKQRKSLEKRMQPIASSKETSSKVPQLNPVKAKGTLFHAKHFAKAYAGQAVLADLQFRIEPGDKIALVGPNGTGKTSLLAMIAGQLESDNPAVETVWHRDAKLMYGDQLHRGVQDEVPLVQQLGFYVSEERARMLLAFVGLPERSWTKWPATLSGGERARMGLALLIAAEKNLLLLDEPSNDLDIPMIEALEKALVATDAAVLFASHDEALINKVAARIWSLENGELVEYRGGVEGYFKGTRRIEPELFASPPAAEVLTESLQEKLERLELERLELETFFLDPGRYSDRDVVRARLRYRELLSDLSLVYDARLPAPLPAYSSTVDGVKLSTDGIQNSEALFQTNASFSLKLLVSNGLGHVMVVADAGCCPLAWAEQAALRALSELAFEHLNLKALQLQVKTDPQGAGFKPAGHGWWVQTLSDYEQRLGYTDHSDSAEKIRRKRKRRRRRRAGRKKYKHPNKAEKKLD